MKAVLTTLALWVIACLVILGVIASLSGCEARQRCNDGTLQTSCVDHGGVDNKGRWQ